MAISGTWNVTTVSVAGKAEGQIILEDKGDGTLEGKVVAMGMEAPLENGTVDGDSFSCQFSGDSPMGHMTMDVKGSVDGDKIKGTMKARIGGAKFSGTRASE